MSSRPPLLRIKLLDKFKGNRWASQFPGGNPVWGNCRFITDHDCRDYDWLVVYDDLPAIAGERHTLWEEQLACSRRNTLLITAEPSTIKVYGSRFLRQFGWVLTSQEPWVINHPGTIRHQPGLVWFYAHSLPRASYDAVSAHTPLDKRADISAVCSVKQQRHTLHRKRYDFVMALKQQLPGLELFGRGHRELVDKADALDSFRYHVAVENFFGPHHWTEKLADPFLGACMPLYYGCPNAEDYFPPESFLRLDIRDVDAAVSTIQRALTDRLYEKNLGAILESRRLVLEKYAPLIQICRLVEEHNDPAAPAPAPGDVIMSRHRLRRRSLVNGVSFAIEKAYVATRHALHQGR